MAEISVPAWPIPIQNTKVVMYIAHITGVRLPAAPIPTQIWYDHARMPAVRTSPTTHIHPKYRLPGNVRVLMTSRLTSANVGPVAADLSLIHPRQLPGHLLQVRDRRAGAQLLEHVVAAWRARQPGHPARAVLQVAEGDRLGRAGLLARGPDVAVAHRPLHVPRAILARDDAVQAHRALL